MAGSLHCPPIRNEEGDIVREQIACAVHRDSLIGLLNPSFARKMALRAYVVAPRRVQQRGIDHATFTGNVFGAAPVASLASDAILRERRFGVAVHGAINGPRLAGVAPQTVRFNRTTPA